MWDFIFRYTLLFFLGAMTVPALLIAAFRIPNLLYLRLAIYWFFGNILYNGPQPSRPEENSREKSQKDEMQAGMLGGVFGFLVASIIGVLVVGVSWLLEGDVSSTKFLTMATGGAVSGTIAAVSFSTRYRH